MAAALMPPIDMDISEDNILFNEGNDMMNLYGEERALDDSPKVSKTMQSFQEKGMLETFREGDKFRNRSSPGFRHKDESNGPHSEKPR